MAKLFVKRLLHAVPLLFGISLLSFLIIAWTPGDPLANLLDKPHITRETLEALRHNLGLDLPVHIRYWRWLSGLVRGDFGHSLQFQVPVSTLIGPALINTLILSLSATAVSILVGIPLGIVAAMRRGGWIDRLSSVLATASLSTPRIFLALLALLMAAKTGWFPIGGQYAILFDQMTEQEKIVDALHHLVLPTLILSLAPLAVYFRQMRGNLLDTLDEDFVKIGRAKGLSERAVILKHAMRTALNPVITLLGYSIGGLLNGSALVESVMVWPGIGRMTIQAVLARDIYVIMAAVMIASVTLIVGNLLADMLLGLNDPRIKLEA